MKSPNPVAILMEASTQSLSPLFHRPTLKRQSVELLDPIKKFRSVEETVGQANRRIVKPSIDIA
jgi:hypothetical protein